MEKLAEQIVLDILATEMALEPNTYWIRDQNKKIPGEKQLFVIAGMVDSVVMSSQTYIEERVTPQPPDPALVEELEINRVQMAEYIQIDIVSRNNSAITRRWEILAALESIYSKQQQEEYVFKIFKLPRTFGNTSYAEGGSQLNRYSITIACFVWYRKEKVLSPDGGDYYDDFDTRVDDSKTIGTAEGIIEFNISAEE